MPQPTGIILDDPATATGHDKYNDLAYLEVHDHYRSDARQILLYRPVVLLRALASAWFCYFRPASDLSFYFDAEVAPIRSWERLFSVVYPGQNRRTDQHEEIRRLFWTGRLASALSYTGVWLLVLIPIFVIWAFVQLVKPSGENTWSGCQRILLSFMLLTITLLTLTVNTLAAQENNRYRFLLEPLYLVLVGSMFSRAGRRSRNCSVCKDCLGVIRKVTVWAASVALHASANIEPEPVLSSSDRCQPVNLRTWSLLISPGTGASEEGLPRRFGSKSGSQPVMEEVFRSNLAAPASGASFRKRHLQYSGALP